MGPTVASRHYLDRADCDVDELVRLVATVTPPGSYRHASGAVGEVVVYDIAAFDNARDDTRARRELMAELVTVLRDGPGAFVVTRAVDRGVLDRVTAAFERMITEQRAAGMAAGDHFAKAGANDRLWNALEKLALAEPGLFVDYYATEALALPATAWLGPAYQVTSQLNVVNPGGVAQSPHRDYHLGFMSADQAACYPMHVHAMSALLTLQGAIAHCDMPVETGPTKLLPHSQKYPSGYVAWGRPDVMELFEARCVQPPLAAGDALFFNPALLHAAGSNLTTDVRRMANLLQVSSAFGRAMETVDRTRTTLAVYAALRERLARGAHIHELEAAIAACSEGYAFPTNLDRDAPLGGMAPASQADVVRGALTDGWDGERLERALVALDERRRTS